MAGITITIDDTALRQQLGQLIRALTDPQPALRQIGDDLVRTTKERFQPGNKRAPDGTPWARNSPVTIARKGRDNPLYQRGHLQGSIRYQLLGQNALAVGTNRGYAAVQQFGQPKGASGRNRRGAPIPWGNIPARPFLGLSDQDADDAVRVLRSYLARQAGQGTP
jgi:phage virion morphogenesis protein